MTLNQMKLKVGFIGGGNMASSMIGGLTNQATGNDLIQPQHVWVYDRNKHKMDALNSQFGISLANNCEQIIDECGVVIFAVKPQVLKQALIPLRDRIKAQQTLIISVAAGIQCKTIERWLDSKVALVRVIPNTPSLIGLGVSGLFANQNVSDQQKELSNSLMQTIGITHWVDNESNIDLITALSGSGPAYFMLFIQSLIDAGVDAGMDQSDAKKLVLQTSIGATGLIKHSEQTIPDLIKNISSPNGTTEQAITSLKNAQLTKIVTNAFTAAKNRSEQMAIEFDT